MKEWIIGIGAAIFIALVVLLRRAKVLSLGLAILPPLALYRSPAKLRGVALPPYPRLTQPRE